MGRTRKLVINENEALAAVDLAYATCGEDERELRDYHICRKAL